MRAVLLGSLALGLFVPSESRAQWEGSPIDTLTRTQTAKYTTAQSLALDPSDHAHVTWRSASYNPTDFRIWYATNQAAGAWSQPVALGDGGANSPAIAFSAADGVPLVSFDQDESDASEIYLAHPVAGVWARERITNNGTFDRFSTIAVDSAGFVHLAWVSMDAAGVAKLGYASGRPGAWQLQRLEATDHPMDPVLAVTPDGVAHIAYRGGLAPGFRVHHAWNDTRGGAAWQDEVVTSGNDADVVPSLTIDRAGGLHVGIGGYGPSFEISPRTVYYRYHPPGGVWAPAEFVAENAYLPSVGLTPTGRPHILWAEMGHHGIPVLATGRVFESFRDAGGTWHSVAVIDSDYFYACLKMDGQGHGHVAAGTGGNTGVYDIYHVRSRVALAGVDGHRQHDPAGPRLLSGRPNPFASQTVIRFAIPERAPVSLKVYDVLGAEVTTLADETLGAGFYARSWDATAVPSGLYFCRLAAGGHRGTMKLVHLK